MWWDSLSDLRQISFIIGTIATIIMILFIVLMLMGMDGGESFDGDIDIGDIDGTSDLDIYNSDSVSSISGLRIISIRGALAFFSIGGWTVYLFADSLSPLVSIIIGLIAGSIAAVLLALAMKSILKLESSGNLDYRTAVGKIATVYIRVPKEANGKGKVIFNHQGKMVEVDAITNELEDILSKSEVKIINLIDESTLVVEKNLKKEN
jgi:hypothetical protein